MHRLTCSYAELHCCGEDLQCVQSALQSDLSSVQDWLQANRLQLNVSKSVIGSWQKLQNRSVSVSINGKPLTSISSTRYLGVLMHRSAFELEITCRLCFEES